MPKFATARIAFFDNVLHMEVIEAYDELAALTYILQVNYWQEVDCNDTIEDLKRLAFDCEYAIGAIEIKGE